MNRPYFEREPVERDERFPFDVTRAATRAARLHEETLADHDAGNEDDSHDRSAE